MSLTDMNAESAIAAIVEAMLPRFSDSQLGLHMSLDLHFADHGYDADGNTQERKPKGIRRLIGFLFVRPSNYTKVFIFDHNDETGFPSHKPSEWFMGCDHDSCWRDAVGSRLMDVSFQCSDQFKGRKIGEKPLRPIDLYRLVTFWESPGYVRFDTFEQKNKDAGRFSNEGRNWLINFHEISFAELEMLKSPDTKKLAHSGLLVKGSERHTQYNKMLAMLQNPV